MDVLEGHDNDTREDCERNGEPQVSLEWPTVDRRIKADAGNPRVVRSDEELVSYDMYAKMRKLKSERRSVSVLVEEGGGLTRGGTDVT